MQSNQSSRRIPHVSEVSEIVIQFRKVWSPAYYGILIQSTNILLHFWKSLSFSPRVCLCDLPTAIHHLFGRRFWRNSYDWVLPLISVSFQNSCGFPFQTHPNRVCTCACSSTSFPVFSWCQKNIVQPKISIPRSSFPFYISEFSDSKTVKFQSFNQNFSTPAVLSWSILGWCPLLTTWYLFSWCLLKATLSFCGHTVWSYSTLFQSTPPDFSLPYPIVPPVFFKCLSVRPI